MGQVGLRPATLVVTVESKEAVAGSVVRGRVYVDVVKDSLDFTRINMSIIGSEITRINPKDRNEINRRKFKYNTLHNFYNVCYPLCEIDGALTKGNYEFPFQFPLPVDLPPSMNCANEREDYCAVKYHVDVRLHRKGLLRWDVQDQVEITLLSVPLDRFPSPVTFMHNPAQISSCCFNYGSIHCGAHLSAGVLIRGRELDISHIVLNNSTKDIRRVIITLTEHALWKAAKHKHPKPSELHRAINKKKLFNREIDVSTMTGEDLLLLQPIPQLSKHNQIIDEHTYNLQIQDKINKRIKSNEAGNRCCFIVPLGALETYSSGKYIDVWHTLKIEAVTSFGLSNVVVYNNVLLRRYVHFMLVVIHFYRLFTQST